MIGVLLADDNRLILEHFKTLVDWNQYGFELVSAAVDGMEAYLDFQKYHPEVVITDIQMPEMTGIELAKRIKGSSPETTIVFLSSYEEFSYVKSALKIGVYDYILKHETDAEKMIEMLLSIKKHIEHQNLKKSFLVEGPLLSLFHELEEGHTENDLQKYQTIFPDQYSLLLLEQDCFFPAISACMEKTLEEVKEKHVKKIIYDRVNKPLGIAKMNSYQYLVLLPVHIDAVEYAYEIKNALRAGTEKTFSVIVCAIQSSMIECVGRFVEKKNALARKFFYPAATVLYLEHLEYVGKEISIPHIAKLSDFLKSKDFESFLRALDKSYLTAIDAKDYDSLFTITYEYLNQLMDYHQRVVDFQTGKTFFVYDERSVQHWYDAASIFDWIKGRFLVLTGVLSRNLFPEYSKEVVKIISYINENYSDSDLSAEKIATVFSSSVNSLNTLFKRETGNTLWQLIIKIRMEQAKTLLDQKDLKISEVCDRIGYKTISYFSKVFKKVYGISPHDYRREQHDTKKV